MRLLLPLCSIAAFAAVSLSPLAGASIQFNDLANAFRYTSEACRDQILVANIDGFSCPFSSGGQLNPSPTAGNGGGNPNGGSNCRSSDPRVNAAMQATVCQFMPIGPKTIEWASTRLETEELQLPDVEPPTFESPNVPATPDLSQVSLPDPALPVSAPAAPSLPTPTTADASSSEVVAALGAVLEFVRFGAPPSDLEAMRTPSHGAAPVEVSTPATHSSVGSASASADASRLAAPARGSLPILSFAAIAISILLAPAIAFYNRLTRRRVLQSESRERLLAHVATTPGTTVSQAACALAVHFTTAEHHLRILLRHGHVVVDSNGRGKRFFENHGRYKPDEQRRIVLMRDTENERFLRLVAQKPGITVSMAARQLGVAKSTVSRRATLLSKDGLVLRQGKGLLLGALCSSLSVTDQANR